MTHQQMLGFLANTPGIQIRESGGEKIWRLVGFHKMNQCVSVYRWRTIDKDGNVGEEQEFLVRSSPNVHTATMK